MEEQGPRVVCASVKHASLADILIRCRYTFVPHRPTADHEPGLLDFVQMPANTLGTKSRSIIHMDYICKSWCTVQR